MFDEKDRQFFRNQALFGYGFVESLAAILPNNATGYMPIFGSFGWQAQPRENILVKELVSEKTWEIVTSMGKYHSQPPAYLLMLLINLITSSVK